MNVDIPIPSCNFLFIMNLFFKISLFRNNTIIVSTICLVIIVFIVIAIMFIYKKFSKNTKMSRIFLGIGFVKHLRFFLFSKLIKCNTEMQKLVNGD